MQTLFIQESLMSLPFTLAFVGKGNREYAAETVVGDNSNFQYSILSHAKEHNLTPLPLTYKANLSLSVNT